MGKGRERLNFGREKISVTVKPTDYHVKAMDIEQHRNGIVTLHRPAQEIHRKGFKYKRKDIGAPGKGPRIIKGLKKGKMTKIAVQGRFIKEGQRVSDIPASRMDDFARYLAKRVGPARAFRMFQVQLLFRKRQPNGFQNKMLRARETIAKEYPEALTPKAAIREWSKGMTPTERAKATPSRKGRPGYKLIEGRWRKVL